MIERLSTHGVGPRRCALTWCVTAHGETVHPDDEDHRSAGVGVMVRARRGDARGPGEETELEIGAVRRVDDSETWIVIETGIGVSLALTRDGARSLSRLLRDDTGPNGRIGLDDDL
jgi:hypothetical protein